MKASDRFSQIFLNLLNHELRGNSTIPTAGNISLNVDQLSLIKLIEGDQEPDLAKNLKVCCSLALKIELSRSIKNSPEDAFKNSIQYLKHLSGWRFVPEYEFFQETPQQDFNPFEQLFTEDLHDQILLQYSSFFYSYMKQIKGDQIESLNLKSYLFNLVTLSFKITQKDQVMFKKLGVKMLSQVIEIFKTTVESLGDDDSDEDSR